MAKHLFEVRSVSEHPDKIADQTDDRAGRDPRTGSKARVACRNHVKNRHGLVGGEITTSAWVDIEGITAAV